MIPPTDEFYSIIKTCTQSRNIENHEIKQMIASLANQVRELKISSAKTNTEKIANDTNKLKI